jgi:hypothetical protein
VASPSAAFALKLELQLVTAEVVAAAAAVGDGTVVEHYQFLCNINMRNCTVTEFMTSKNVPL